MARRQIPDLPLARRYGWINCPCGRRTYATYIVGGQKPFVRIQKPPGRAGEAGRDEDPKGGSGPAEGQGRAVFAAEGRSGQLAIADGTYRTDGTDDSYFSPGGCHDRIQARDARIPAGRRPGAAGEAVPDPAAFGSWIQYGVGILGIAVIGQLWIILKQFAAANEQMKQAHDDSEKLNETLRGSARTAGQWGGQEGAVRKILDLKILRSNLRF